MSFQGWQKEAEKAGAEKLPLGTHDVKIVRLVWEKQGEPMLSQSGDVQFMVIFQDAAQREAALTITLSAKAAWVLARLCSRAGMDLAKMDEAGVGLDRFEDREFANKNLLNRELAIKLTQRQGSQYPDIEPLVRGAAATGDAPAYGGKPDPEDDVIPF